MRGWALLAAVASAGAGAIHHAATPEHLDEWPAAGLVLFSLGVAQIAWAAGVSRGGDGWRLAGIALNGGAVALWVTSRTVGLPVGPMPGRSEHIHGADLLATALEVGIIAACVAMTSAQAAPSGPLGRLWVAASLGALVVTGHDPARERLIATAALAIAVVGAALVTMTTNRGRSHVQAHRRPGRVRARAVVRAGAGAI